MSTGPTPIHRGGRLEGVWRSFAALALLLLAGIVVMVLVDRGAGTPGAQSGIGSGIAATQARSLPPFTGVELAGDNNVVVRSGARQSVTVHADSNLLGRVTTRVSSGTLVIGTVPGALNARSPMFVTVSVPSLRALTVQGSGNISVTEINSPSLVVRLPGSGTVHASGTAARLDVGIAGSGTALLSQLVARDATASIEGSGSIILTVTHRLNANISGSGSILFMGNPSQVSKSVTGSGTISGG